MEGVSSSFLIGNVYNECGRELAEQQKKRDQTVLFFLTGEGLIVSSSLSVADKIANLASALFVVMFLIGLIFSLTIIRYKIHRNRYYVSYKVLQKLMALGNENINVDRLNFLTKEFIEEVCCVGKKNKVRMKYNFFSAETLMYQAFICINFLNVLMFAASISPIAQLWQQLVIVGVFAIYIIAFNLMYYLMLKYDYDKVVKKDTKDIYKAFSYLNFI